ncbi:hypothetical protein AC579_1678 [Pseudocercospora musae]|uniref:Uncharacterized protein n=1 Tax=Pseudocercospora musae TaxID=113226 RepID=A0A139I9K6_9PEZI|nr:hypothetical protein AC579_1678 [Pseudocercospora musae]
MAASTSSAMGSAGSKVCESEKFEQHQQGFARASEAFSQKRTRSPGSDLVTGGPPQPKRSRRSDDQIEEVRKDLERRFEALRSQAGLQAAQSTEIHTRADQDASNGRRSGLEQQPSSPSSCATFGHAELADVPDEQSDDSMLWVRDSRSPSPELPAAQIDEHVGYGWSTRETHADTAELSNILLLTHDWPDYAAAFRNSGKQNIGHTLATNQQLNRSTFGIELANYALKQVTFEPGASQTGSLKPKARSDTPVNADNASPQLPNSVRVANAFDERDMVRNTERRAKSKAPGAHISGRQTALTGVWQRNASQSLAFSRSNENWSLNKNDGREVSWEPLRSQRHQPSN